VRLDPSTGRTQEVVKTGGDPRGLAAADGAVWVADDESGMVDRIDARTGSITSTVRVGDAPAASSAGSAGVWVLDPLDATVSQIDPNSNAVLATLAVGGAPTAVTQYDGSVWVTDGRQGILLRLDPRRREIADTLALGGSPDALVAGSGLWVAFHAAGAARRAGTLTSAIGYQLFDTIDPAASNSPNLPPPQEFGLTNDGLVTLDHVAGPAGARLVPDLALALPAPTDHGLTYAFHLRPEIQYSTGAVIKPSDITNSFERLFEIRSSGASFYQSILGASACGRAPQSCDLSRGIVADNSADTVTFHLTRPDPDFLDKLTLAYADVLPASTPARQATTPLPATGPYMIAHYRPGKELQLVRNPRFREWSAAAQPNGYPNQIVIRLDLNQPDGVAAIADGKADFSPNLGAIPGRHAAYSLGHDRSQVHINPQMITGFMFLNVNVAPFNDVRVRRALNFALDRQAIVKAYGGPIAARPTCQILPPRIAGVPALLPLHHGAERRRSLASTGPDRGPTAGRCLSHKRNDGHRLERPHPQAAVDETRAAVTALKELGYHASLRLLPVSTYFTYTNDSRNRAQVVDGGWSADYASADDFIGKLTCGYFVPRDGLDTTDASEFCVPPFDKRAARAAALQTTDPPAADSLWARLHHELTDLAIWVPTVTPNEIDLVSRRVGNYQYNPVWGALLDQMWVR
jgi:peptide/nickel transport system substrate-binding protein